MGSTPTYVVPAKARLPTLKRKQMAKIFAPPAVVGPAPDLFGNAKNSYGSTVKPLNVYQQEVDEWVETLRQWVCVNYKNDLAGEVIYEPVADGRAMYMVMTPTQLIHLPLGDAYRFQWDKNWKATDIRLMVKRAKAIQKLFERK